MCGGGKPLTQIAQLVTTLPATAGRAATRQIQRDPASISLTLTLT
ncbi:hypothetical protein XGA_2128 [Xanthomonas hortorum ATCC 19865]|nr:hypothetical protein XGA_2128 [Xanthomonas hortorum ATCC 19865]